MKKTKIKLDKIGSVLKDVNLSFEITSIPMIDAIEGEAIAVQVLGAQRKYGELELTDGRMAMMREGDIIAGALGERKALEGIVGVIPQKIKYGDGLNILNLGGVIGTAVSWNKDFVSSPINVKVLGSIVVGKKLVNIHNYSLQPQAKLENKIPIIAVLGTAMGVGKTTVATELIHTLVKKKGLKVAAAKLTGVATQRDILAMKDVGAMQALTFHDVGLTSTLNNHDSVVPATKTILNLLNKKRPEIIVVELGDGIVGWYGVEKLLTDKEFIQSVSFTIICAHDLVGAVGAKDLLEKKGLVSDFFAGPVTNNTAGTDYLEQILKIPSADIRDDKSKLMKVLEKKGVIKHD
ncbi:hypothetical protein HYW55_05115 [Candidatus Gottesmanbacteria bacterium]|nr:hypothetical protein [Candidatus Gottesmanbacteria bacterium]